MSGRENVRVCRDEINRQNQFIHLIREMGKGRIRRYKMSTFGCQMNENDSERLAGMLSEMGYIEADDLKESDLIIYNTCCVRENAELKVYGHLGRLKKFKKDNPELIIAVCGCMMQQAHIVKHIVKKYSHVDLIFGTHNLFKFPELLYSYVTQRKTIVDIRENEGAIAEGLPIERKDGVKAWVTIMYGCDNFCSYCIVPHVRGRERSREFEDVINEVSMLGHQGYKEVTLLGQNVNSYGKDKGGRHSFAELLCAVNETEGIERIRFMTSHPKDLSEDLIEAMKSCRKVCEHLHLPVQAGSSRILERMNRRYSKEQYTELALKIKEAIPEIALTTDIIVGFPGETEEDFDDTIDILETIRFDSAYTFLYSKRTGTPAAGYPDQVPEEVKKARFDRLISVQNRISRQINDALLGTGQEVLVEGTSRNNPDVFSGRTRTNKIVNFKGSVEMIGSLVNVEVTKALTWSLEGKIIL
jgi:tRNA-2-methylthio-N6-dimethylallyladenosine synthase